MMCQIDIILSCYFAIANFLKPLTPVIGMRNILACIEVIISIKRLVYLTSLVYSFQEKVSEVEDKLFDFEVKDYHISFKVESPNNTFLHRQSETTSPKQLGSFSCCRRQEEFPCMASSSWTEPSFPP